MNDIARLGGPIGKHAQLARRWLAGRVYRGTCPVCGTKAFFVVEGSDPGAKDHCWRCGGLPQSRGILSVLDEAFPHWRDLSVHEWSPGGVVSEKLFRECPRYLPSHYSASVERGEVVNGLRCESLTSQTFPASRFDLIVTVGLFDRVSSPSDAFPEIARTLKPGGAHLFTVSTDETEALGARELRDIPKTRDTSFAPTEKGASPSVRVWAQELPALIHAWSGLFTTVFRIRDRKLGISGAPIEVYVSRKLPQTPRRSPPG